MKDWILYSLKCRKSQAGFALPVAIGMGLIILLVGLTMLLRSQDSQVSAIAQKDTAKSLNAAETGVNEIRALINQHRAIAVYPACENRDSNGTCLDSGSTPSWRLPNNIASLDKNLALSCNNYTDPQKSSIKTEITKISNRTWQPVNPDNPSQGEYRLLDYTYTGTPGIPEETGTLSVQGRVNDGEPSEAISQLEVEIPTAAPTEGSPGSYRVSGLWVQTSANVGVISSDIVGDCNASITAQPTDGYHVRQLNLPPIPDTPDPDSAPNSATSLTNEELSDPLGNPVPLPRKDDPLNEETQTYQYKISGNLTSDFTVDNSDPDKPMKVIELWVDGEINLEGKFIRHSCDTRPGCGPFQVKIYGISASNQSVAINQATTLCDVFIHAPNYRVTYSSTGGSAVGCGGTIKNTGVFWVDSWNGDLTSTPVLDPPRGYWSQVPIVANIIDYFPTTEPIKAWNTQERSVN